MQLFSFYIFIIFPHTHTHSCAVNSSTHSLFLSLFRHALRGIDRLCRTWSTVVLYRGPQRCPQHTTHAQIQLYGFNKELYHNMSEAQHKAQGIVGISLMLQIGDTPNPELRIITSAFNKVLYKGKLCLPEDSDNNAHTHTHQLHAPFSTTLYHHQSCITSFFLYFFFCWGLGSSTPIRHISLRSLLPNTEQYMTYEGSTTHPGCWESTVWIILNKPIYITKQEVSKRWASERTFTA